MLLPKEGRNMGEKDKNYAAKERSLYCCCLLRRDESGKRIQQRISADTK